MRNEKLDLLRRLPLRAHSLLAGVPLHDLWIMDLPGGPEGMSMVEINAVVGFVGEREMRVGPVTQALFSLRNLIGRLLRWDDVPELASTPSYIDRLTEQDRTRSYIAPGVRHGIIRDLYMFEGEYAGEIINRTVHAFVVTASERVASGYRIYVAIYVARVSWFTPIYLFLITLPCLWVIYPSMRRGIRRRWLEAFATGHGGATAAPTGSSAAV
jgi:hypothetical protein